MRPWRGRGKALSGVLLMRSTSVDTSVLCTCLWTVLLSRYPMQDIGADRRTAR